MSDLVSSVNESTFNDTVTGSDKPVVVDFWAEWCGPCKMLAPVLEEVAAEHSDKLKIVKVDVQENHSLAAKYGVSAIPTLVVFKGGEVAGTIQGFRDKASLEQELAAYA